MGGRLRTTLAVIGGSLCGCEASLPPEAQPKPFSLTYAKGVLVGQKASWILTNADTVRDAKVGKFDAKLLGQSSVCVAYDWRDRTGAYTGIKPYIVYIAPDHGTIVQAYPADSSQCRLDELQPFPELNGKK